MWAADHQLEEWRVMRNSKKAPVPQDNVREHRDQLCAILDSLADGLLICGLDGSIVEVNEAACTMFGLARHHIVGRELEYFFSANSLELRPPPLVWLKEAPLGAAKTYEVYCDPTAGRPFWAEISVRRVSLAERGVGLLGIRDITEQKRTLHTLLQASRCDLATGLPNRRAFQEVLEHEVARYERYGGYLCVAIGAIDGFDALADRHGAQTGNTIIAQVAELLRGQVRKSDYFASRGREEFAFIIHDAKPDSAVRMLSRMQAGIEQHRMPEIERPVTLRFGVTGYRLSDKAEDLLARIERALAAGTAHGRSRVVVG